MGCDQAYPGLSCWDSALAPLAPALLIFLRRTAFLGVRNRKDSPYKDFCTPCVHGPHSGSKPFPVENARLPVFFSKETGVQCALINQAGLGDSNKTNRQDAKNNKREQPLALGVPVRGPEGLAVMLDALRL